MAISESGRHGDNVVTHVVRVLGPEKGNATIRLRKTEDGTAILDGVLKLSGVMSPTAQVYHSSKILEKIFPRLQQKRLAMLTQSPSAIETMKL